MKKKDKAQRRTKYINSLFTRVLVSIIFLLSSVIFIKHSNDNLLMYKDYVFTRSFKFAPINKLYKKYLGSIIPFDNVKTEDTKTVFNETFNYKESNKYLDGTKFVVDDKYLMPALQSGIVVFMGEKDDYGKTVIIQGIDGVDIWYTNVNSSLKMYDYVEAHSLVGEALSNEVTLVIQKDNKYISFNDYEKDIKN